MEDLNYDCNQNMFLIRSQMSNIPLEDRVRVMNWMRKLASCNQNLDEMRLRNDYLLLLVMNVQKKQLNSPFDRNPNGGPLPDLYSMINGDNAEEIKAEFEKAKSELPYSYGGTQQKDEGTFLAARPVPKCGAFCYLAVLCDTKGKK